MAVEKHVSDGPAEFQHGMRKVESDFPSDAVPFLFADACFVAQNERIEFFSAILLYEWLYYWLGMIYHAIFQEAENR